MRALNHQAILNRVYRHFVIERNPPGIVHGLVAFHHTEHESDPTIDCPCAIGLFDPDHRLHGSETVIMTVAALYRQQPRALAEVFGTDALSPADVFFLSDIQECHDRIAGRYQSHFKHNPEWFVTRMADALFHMAKRYGVTLPDATTPVQTA